ncbi:hypothetical protein J2S28_003862 [Rhizobium sp. SLBN-94]|nr:hypothetical protein [Rhizobium sp. SLBN-94]
MAVIAAQSFRFFNIFQIVGYFSTQRGQKTADFFEFRGLGIATERAGNGVVTCLKPFEGFDLTARSNHVAEFLDIAAAKADTFTKPLKIEPLADDAFGEFLNFRFAGKKRCQRKTVSLADFPSPVFAGVSFSVRAVLANDEAGFDKSRKMPAQCLFGHAMGTE